MVDNKSLDFNIIASDCLIATDIDSVKVLDLLEGLKNKYSEMQRIAIFNYFLKIEYRPDVLSYLIKTLDKFRDSSSLEPITNLLLMKDRTPNAEYSKEFYTDVRVLCAKAISNLKNHISVHPLMYCLNDKNENYKIRLSCADALGKLGDKYAVTTLMDVVSDESEKSVYIRESAAVALGLIGDIRAVDSLVNILETKNGIMDKFTYLKEKVVEAICKLNPNNDRVFKALKNALFDENPQIRINTIEALMEYDTDEAKDLIKIMLKDEDDEVKRNAVIALFNMSEDDEADGVLRGILDNPDYSEVCKEEAQNILENEQEYDEK